MDQSRKSSERIFPSSADDVRNAQLQPPESPAAQSAAYRLAYTDDEFLLRPELRSVRLQLELLKPELVQQEQGVEATIAIFGSARTLDRNTADAQLEAAKRDATAHPSDKKYALLLKQAEKRLENSRYYEEARRLAHLITAAQKDRTSDRIVVVTGGGPGIMEAANRGAHEAGGASVGLSIVLPLEQGANRYITPELSFQFHYFAIRKMHFLIRARAMVAFPGGFGTFDELFETLTLIQTHKIAHFPIVLVGQSFWNNAVNFDALIEEGVISPEDVKLFSLVDTADEAFEILKNEVPLFSPITHSLSVE